MCNAEEELKCHQRESNWAGIILWVSSETNAVNLQIASESSSYCSFLKTQTGPKVNSVKNICHTKFSTSYFDRMLLQKFSGIINRFSACVTFYLNMLYLKRRILFTQEVALSSPVNTFPGRSCHCDARRTKKSRWCKFNLRKFRYCH